MKTIVATLMVSSLSLIQAESFTTERPKSRKEARISIEERLAQHALERFSVGAQLLSLIADAQKKDSEFACQLLNNATSSFSAERMEKIDKAHQAVIKAEHELKQALTHLVQLL